MNIPWLKLIGASAGIASVIGIPLAIQSRVDAGQDTRIEQVEQDQRSGVTVLQANVATLRAADDELGRNNRATAEALRDVASTLREIDKRGTLAGRDHELNRDVHSP